MSSSPRALFAAVFGALVASAAGCSDSTSPSGIQVTVTAQLVGPASIEDAGDWPRVTCTVDLTAQAQGPGRAVWREAKIRFFLGGDRSSATDSVTFPASEVAGAWDRDTIIANRSSVTRDWTIWHDFPFDAEFEFRYQTVPGQSTGTATADVRCGPTVDASSPPPVVESANLTADLVLEPGGRVSIDYSARSSLGLWETVVVLGPEACRQVRAFSEHSQPTVTRALQITVPLTCPLGTVVRATVFAYDAAARFDGRSSQGRTVVDVSPPHLEVSLGLLGGGGAQYVFVGDNLALTVSGGDPSGVTAIVWDAGPGLRDSTVVAGTTFHRTTAIPMSSAWLGTRELRVRVHDAVGLMREWVSPSIRVLPTLARPTLVVAVGGATVDGVIDQKRGEVYLIQNGLPRILVASLATGTVTGTITLPSPARDADLSAGGDSLLVVLPLDRALGVVDLRAQPRVVVAIPISIPGVTVDHPTYARVAASGKAFVGVLTSAPSAYRVLEVDLSNGTQRLRTEAGAGGPPASASIGGYPFERSLDHQAILMIGGNDACLIRYDAGSDTFGPCQSKGAGPPSADLSGNRIAVGLDIHRADLTFLRRVESVFGAGAQPLALALSPDGEVLYYSGVAIFRAGTSDGRLLDRTPLPFEPRIYRVSPDGTFMVLVERAPGGTSPRIAIIDMRD